MIEGDVSVTGAVTTVLENEWLVTYAALDPVVRGVGQFAFMVLLAGIVVGVLPSYGTRSVAKARRSPILSCCVGAPIGFVLVSLLVSGYLLIETAFGAFFGILVFVIGAVALPAVAAIGSVAVGRSVASTLGQSRPVIGVFVGSLLWGVAGVWLSVTVALMVIATALGIGAAVRVLFGILGADSPDDRTIPPANKI